MKKMSIEEFYHRPLSELKAPSILGDSQVVINDDNTLSLIVKVEEKHMNLHGSLQASMHYHISDTALGMYLIHIGRPGVAMDGHIYLYRPGRLGDTLTTTIFPHKLGRRTGIVSAELRDQDGKMISECMYSVMFDN
ncbi:MAG: hypothetical protein IKX76_06555 [Eubacterium sp.]|nr:hypothetical protein [Eubacterium sp.]